MQRSAHDRVESKLWLVRSEPRSSGAAPGPTNARTGAALASASASASSAGAGRTAAAEATIAAWRGLSRWRDEAAQPEQEEEGAVAVVTAGAVAAGAEEEAEEREAAVAAFRRARGGKGSCAHRVQLEAPARASPGVAPSTSRQMSGSARRCCALLEAVCPLPRRGAAR